MNRKHLQAAGHSDWERPAALLFDLGGVLVDLDDEAFFRAWQELGVSREAMLAFREGQCNLDWNTGRIGEEAFIRELVQQLAPASRDPKRLRLAWQSMIGPVHAQVEKMALESGLPLAILSNTDPWHWDRARASLSKNWNTFVLSFETGWMKPAAEAFEAAARAVDKRPGACLLIDDTQENLHAARELGMLALEHRRNTGENTELAAWLNR